MAGPYYWVGGSGNWSDATNHWSTSSGGAPNAANVPTSVDDVHFDAASNTTAYTVTVNATANCRDLMFDAAPSVSGTVTFAGSSALNVYGSRKLLSGMTFTYSGTMTFAATSTGKTLTQNSVTETDALVFNGTGGGWTLQDALVTTGASGIGVTAGSLDMNSKNVTAPRFYSNGSAVRSITAGTNTLTWTEAAGTGFLLNGTNLSGSFANCDLYYNGAGNIRFGGYDFTYKSFSHAGTVGGASTIMTNGVFSGNFSFNTPNSTSNIAVFATIVVNGTLTITSAGSTTGRLLVASSINNSALGTPVTITAANVVHGNVDYQDVTAAGAGWATATTTGFIGDALGNSGITFTPSVTQYWYTATGGVKNWSTAGNWYLGSGGTGGAGRVPLPQDDVVFNSGSFGAAGTTVNVDMTRFCRNMTWTGVTNSPSIIYPATSEIFGSVTYTSGMGHGNGGQLNLRGRGSHTITSAGLAVTAIQMFAPGGTYTLQDALTITLGGGTMSVSNGTLNTGNFNVTTAARTLFQTSQVAPAVILGSSTWTLTSTGNFCWYNNGGASQVQCGTSTIKYTSTSSSTKQFIGGGATYHNVWFAPGAGTGTVEVTGSNTFNQFKDDGSAAHSILFTAGTTQNIADWQVNGSSGALITIGSITAASHTLNKTGGGFNQSNYLSISRSTATPATSWYAANSTNGGNNSGWTFGARVNAAAGAFALAGQAAGLRAGRKLFGAAASFAVSGQSAGLYRSRRIDAAAGAFVLAGKAANLIKGIARASLRNTRVGSPRTRIHIGRRL